MSGLAIALRATPAATAATTSSASTASSASSASSARTTASSARSSASSAQSSALGPAIGAAADDDSDSDAGAGAGAKAAAGAPDFKAQLAALGTQLAEGGPVAPLAAKNPNAKPAANAGAAPHPLAGVDPRLLQLVAQAAQPSSAATPLIAQRATGIALSLAKPGQAAGAAAAATDDKPGATAKPRFASAAKPDDRTAAAAAAATADDAVAAPAPDDGPRTPLEQAVHDLIDQLRDAGHAGDDRDAADDIQASRAQAGAPLLPSLAHVAAAAPPAAAAAAAPSDAPRAAAQLSAAATGALSADPAAQPAAAASHVHLVVGDGDDRVVVTVAVRGADVNVSTRASDEHTAAAIARNAASLDEAMRTRGLALSDLHSDRDRDPRPRERERAPHDQPPPRHPDEPFTLEETP